MVKMGTSCEREPVGCLDIVPTGLWWDDRRINRVQCFHHMLVQQIQIHLQLGRRGFAPDNSAESGCRLDEHTSAMTWRPTVRRGHCQSVSNSNARTKQPTKNGKTCQNLLLCTTVTTLPSSSVQVQSSVAPTEANRSVTTPDLAFWVLTFRMLHCMLTAIRARSWNARTATQRTVLASQREPWDRQPWETACKKQHSQAHRLEGGRPGPDEPCHYKMSR